MNFQAAHLELCITPSRRHCALLLLVHALAGVALLLSGVEPWLATALGFAILVSFVWSLHRFGLLREARSVVYLVYRVVYLRCRR